MNKEGPLIRPSATFSPEGRREHRTLRVAPHLSLWGRGGALALPQVGLSKPGEGAFGYLKDQP
jgi:hypothetical protein